MVCASMAVSGKLSTMVRFSSHLAQSSRMPATWACHSGPYQGIILETRRSRLRRGMVTTPLRSSPCTYSTAPDCPQGSTSSRTIM
jgi:hypothetical protein